MKKIIPLIFSVLYVISSNAQAVGGWGTCEFATVATMNAFDPSTNAYDCKKVFVQATNEHYYWNGTVWVLVQDTDTDDQNASEVPFTPVGTILATDVQAAIAEIEPDIYGSIDVHSDVDITTTTPSNGDLLSWDGSNFVPTSTDNGYTIFNVFAEESASLDAGQTEWSFGNGDNTPTGHGIVIPVDCELFAMSLDHEGGSNTTVRITQNSNTSLSTYQVSNSGSENGYNIFGTPLSFSAGDIANFRTISASSSGSSGRASAWFRIRSTPASTSLVNDMLDVSAGSIANGDVLYFDGSSFVPLTLNAANIPYDNTISGLTASNVKAAIDELASGSGGSSDNLYNIDGTIDANREVSLDNFDLEFNSTGTGDFFVSDNGTIVFAVEDDHVGIGIDSPTKPLHIYESTGTPASATNGTIFLEKGDSGGSQSIVFESTSNSGSDYGYIEYSDDGSGNGSGPENSLLKIGIENDGNGHGGQDDIAIMPSGNLGVGTVSPDAFLDVDGGQVRFSNYGSGTYDDASAARVLGVQADGDIIEIDPSTLGGTSTYAVGSIYITSPATTSLSTNTPAKVSGTTALVNESNVDMPTDNRLRYTGTGTKTFLVTCSFTINNTNQDNTMYYYIYKNGLVESGIEVAEVTRRTNSSTRYRSVTLSGTVQLSNNQYIELWAANSTDGDDVIISHMNLSMASVNGATSGGSGSSDNFYTADGALGEDRVVTLDGNSLTFEGSQDIVFQADGDVGIGTNSPDRKLDVEGGQVRFSDYGTGTYEDTTAVYLLGVEADGDIIEMNTAKNSRIFYPPAIAVVANTIDTDLTIDLHQQYLNLFESPAISSTSAPGAIPTYDQDELYYYITDYDTDVFENITIDDNGLMEYDVKAVATSDTCSFINVVFVVKEP